MSTVMKEEIKRWIARRRDALVLDTIQGKTTRHLQAIDRG